MDYQRTAIFYKVTEIEIQGFLLQVSMLCKFFLLFIQSVNSNKQLIPKIEICFMTVQKCKFEIFASVNEK